MATPAMDGGAIGHGAYDRQNGIIPSSHQEDAEASERLFSTIHELKLLNPSFVSVTYGAGGSTRDLTHKLVLRIMEETTIPAIPHLTCVNHSRAEISEILSNQI